MGPSSLSWGFMDISSFRQCILCLSMPRLSSHLLRNSLVAASCAPAEPPFQPFDVCRKRTGEAHQDEALSYLAVLLAHVSVRDAPHHVTSGLNPQKERPS